MLLTRLLRKKNPSAPSPARARWVLFFVIAILASAIVLRLVDTTIDPPRSLLAPAPGLVYLSTLEQLAATTTITPPAQTFGAELFAIGVYEEINDVFPTGTASLVYVKDGWRAFEIDYLPGRRLDEQMALLSLYTQEDIALNETTSATLVTRDTSPRCIDFEDALPNKCEITYQILFERSGLLISLSSDGDHATVGELIEMARSILASAQNTQE
ncbi:hypothetical protein HY631_02555 [Candidatus Uhrbacteria bacterium]|nr:hypothetical protein [Candidatus Uhrbacteria bacterium]